jgi:predicted metal-dependent peptidase
MMAFSTARQLTAEERVQKCVVDIMNNDRYIALAGILVMGNREVRDDVPTAATNGRDEYYGRAFVESMTDAELRYLILHENYHKVFRHLHTWKHLHDKNHMIANMACDYVINFKISEENKSDGFAVMPVCKNTGKPIGLMETRFGEMDAEQVFNIIYEEIQQDEQDGQSGAQGQGSMDDHDWESAQEMTAEEVEQLAEDIDVAIRQGALAAGKMGSGGNRTLEQLLQPEINWLDVLKEFVTTTCVGSDYSTYAKPNRRYMSSGMYMPSGVSEQVEELVIAIDTSGSIGQLELTRFLSEIEGVVQNVKPRAIRLLYWDTKVCGDELYGEGHTEVSMLTESTKPVGGGGTDINCVNEYMKEQQINPQAIIVFTDGYLGGDWGTWDKPVLWCIIDNNSAAPTVGTTLNVKL